jgi:hypothetical protein
MNDYVVWEVEEVPHCFVLDQLEGVDLDVELRTGIPCSESFPSDAVFTVDPDFPNRIRLADTFENTSRLVVASRKLKDFIASFKPEAVEFLPIKLLNHKSKPAGDYFIVHPVSLVDALKPAESGAKWNKHMDDWVDRVDKLVLDTGKIDQSRLIFKLKYFYNCVLVRRDLSEAISKEGFTGIKWTECDQYKSL